MSVEDYKAHVKQRRNKTGNKEYYLMIAVKQRSDKRDEA